ncbi:Flp pilus assembly protein CpaB [Vulcanibacillus modesticaldus]|uniref:Flp pilus assembly protein CpaB n=1 Tax=Vulcanibacillus modesticaldus TaxID=337097 RepID=A0A1D2YV36_9BACI|nr:Flp pilus assembly protein CpaB [Vulcanibacillus modesticaldus]OEF99515.1 Flp pilus assembly protein CpaB [Vulcanibacillus modesticaldus]
MKLTNRKLFIIALFFGIVATSFIYIYLAELEAKTKEIEPTEKVVVAKVTITPRTVITEEMLEVKEYKINSLPPSIYTEQDEVIGQIAKETIYKGEPINPKRLADENYRKAHLAYSIPKGYRALTIQFNPVLGVGGFIKPGDFVDVIGTYDQEHSPLNQDMSKLLLQDILVLAVGTNTRPDLKGQDINTINTITLAVTASQAEKIIYTEEMSSLRLVLRPINENTKLSTTGSTKDNIFAP